MESLYKLEGLESAISSEEIMLVYFSNDHCGVCKTLKPKIAEMMSMQFPRIRLVYIDTEKSPMIAGQYRVFTIPTIDIFVQGKEHARFSRNVNMYELEASLRKPYDILLSE